MNTEIQPDLPELKDDTKSLKIQLEDNQSIASTDETKNLLSEKKKRGRPKSKENKPPKEIKKDNKDNKTFERKADKIINNENKGRKPKKKQSDLKEQAKDLDNKENQIHVSEFELAEFGDKVVKLKPNDIYKVIVLIYLYFIL